MSSAPPPSILSAILSSIGPTGASRSPQDTNPRPPTTAALAADPSAVLCQETPSGHAPLSTSPAAESRATASPDAPSPTTTSTTTVTPLATSSTAPPTMPAPQAHIPAPLSTSSTHIQATLPSPDQQRHVAEARAALVASMENMLDSELQSRATLLHSNAAALDRQERDIVRATDALRSENDKLTRLVDDAAHRLKELGNVQNWAEVLERNFLVLEETMRLVRENEAREGDAGDGESQSNCSCSECRFCYSESEGGDEEEERPRRESQTETLGKIPADNADAASDTNSKETVPQTVPTPEQATNSIIHDTDVESLPQLPHTPDDAGAVLKVPVSLSDGPSIMNTPALAPLSIPMSLDLAASIPLPSSPEDGPQNESTLPSGVIVPTVAVQNDYPTKPIPIAGSVSDPVDKDDNSLQNKLEPSPSTSVIPSPLPPQDPLPDPTPEKPTSVETLDLNPQPESKAGENTLLSTSVPAQFPEPTVSLN